MREGVLQLFYTIAADNASNQMCVGIQRGLRKEFRKGGFLVDVFLQLRDAIPGEPLDYLVEFLNGSAFPFYLADVVGVDRCKRHNSDALVVFGGGFHR